MKLYSYSDLSAPTFTSTQVRAENIIEADAIVKNMGLNVMKLTVAIGVRLIVLEPNSTLKTASRGKILNEVYYKGGTAFTSEVFDNEQELMQTYAREIKVMMYNPNLQLFWEYPTSHHQKLRVRIKNLQLPTRND